MKILVRNLARTTTAETIQSLFLEYGTVSDCVIVIDEGTQQSKGFGFVEMPHGREAVTAIKRLNLARVDGAVIRVKSADTPADNE